MAKDDIERMIEDALTAPEESRGGASPVAHARHILAQYVDLCGDGRAPDAEPSADVEFPVASLAPVTPPASTGAIRSFVRKALGRVKK